MDMLLADVRYALRLLRKSPGFAAVAIATLALGIGATTAIFSTVDTVLIRPLPYADPQRLVMVWEDASFAGFPRNTPAPGNYIDWTRRARTFSGLAATRGSLASLTGDGTPDQLQGRAVTANFFPVLGVTPALGRTFTADEDSRGAPVVLISFGLWQRRYGADPHIVGRTLLMNDNRYEVIGVMPRGFVFRDRQIDYWIPIHFTPEQAAAHNSHYLNVVGRLAPGMSLETAADDMRRVAADLARELPDSNARVGAHVIPLRDDVLGDTRVELLVLMGAAAAVLLIACANLASLLLSRAAGRSSELAVRRAVGATSARLVRQMLVEAMVLSLAGGACGAGVAAAGVSALSALVPRGIAGTPATLLDARLLAFTVAVSVATGILFSIVPALNAARASVRDALQHGSRSAVGGRGRLTRDTLVVLQVAAALALLVSAGLMLRTLANLTAIDLGFRPDHLITMRTSLPTTRYADSHKRLAFYDRVVSQARQVAGVQDVAYTSNLPFTTTGNTQSFDIDGRPAFKQSDGADSMLRVGTPTYLRTIGVQLLEGRLLDERDGENAPPAVVINEWMAKTYWPGASPLGSRIRFGTRAPQPSFTIVGVVRDVRERGYQLGQKPGTYLSFAQFLTTWALPEYLVARVSGPPEAAVESLRRIVASVDPDQPVVAVRTMDDIVALDVADRRQQMMLLGAFAALALLLACVGLYGVLSYAVAQRSRELGLRLALGATTGALVRMIVVRGLSLTGVGLAAGAALAWAATRAMATVLYGVTPSDPATYAAVTALLASVAFLASYLPARRAARLDPSEVLRAD